MKLSVRWTLRESLLSYMARDPDFDVEASGGAMFDPGKGVVLPAVREPDGTIRATGAVVLRAHGGALAIPLIDLVISGTALWVTVPAVPDDTSSTGGLRLATLTPTERADVFDATLAAEADAHFLYNYVPGTDFGKLHIVPA